MKLSDLAVALLLVLGQACAYAAPSAVPATVVAAVLDHFAQYSDQTPGAYCLSLDSERFEQVQAARRDTRILAVPIHECVVETDDVHYGEQQLPAAVLSFSDFQPTDPDSAVVQMHSWCGLLCGGRWRLRLTGSEQIGWWVQSEQPLVVY